ncbi:type II secretion system protein GspJ [Saccharospirillum mangrovi]|uniref:type II secretion system protein GspJ n=1 Tax=Saccharospirillum mangrovi TaxID=2161747 RepID=UPI000D37A723|nr:type II secretion system protein GspJ [Saccharospirillum mangrovi]
MNSQARGFTLIELLIALAISAILAVGTFYLVQTSRQTQTTLVDRNEYRSQLSRVMRTLESDLHQWVPGRPVSDAFGQEQGALLLDNQGFALTRAGWTLSQFTELQRSDLQRVRYRLAEPGSELCPLSEDSSDSDTQAGCLIRSHTIQLDDDGRLEWRSQMLLRPVKAVQWRFLAKVGEEQRFFDAWPPETTQVLTGEPVLRAIDVRLVLPDGEVNRLIDVPNLPEDADGSDAIQ